MADRIPYIKLALNSQKRRGKKSFNFDTPIPTYCTTEPIKNIAKCETNPNEPILITRLAIEKDRLIGYIEPYRRWRNYQPKDKYNITWVDRESYERIMTAIDKGNE